MKTWSLICSLLGIAVAAHSADTGVAAARARAAFTSQPIGFEANLGQADPQIAYLAHGQNGSLFLTRDGARLTMLGSAGETAHTIGLKFAGGNASARLEALDSLPGNANYFFGNNSNQWFTGAARFGRIKYHDLYPGVDLIYYGNQQQLEYDLVVHPGASPEHITLEFTGADKISLDSAGDLLLYHGSNFVRQHKPVVFQEMDGRRTVLSGNYVLHSGMQVGFQIGSYDRTKPLVIDPVLGYSETFGGSGLNEALAVALDAADNVYLAGRTTARDFSTQNPFQTNLLGSADVFVVKLDTNGAVVYSTYLGGGLVNDATTTASSGQGIAVDDNGNAYVTGYTTATNFPVRNAYQSFKRAASYSGRNAFVTELNPMGNALVYSTYLGGSNSDTAAGIALDTNNDAIITGFTSSTNFPTMNAAQPVYGGNGDAFVAKLSADGSALIYSTYLGGSNYENEDLSLAGNGAPLGAVAVDFAGNAFVTGLTYSTNFPVLNAFQPTNGTTYYGAYAAAFVTKLDPSGNLVYSTYFGGRQGDAGRAIGVDYNDNVYFAGNSAYGDLPITNAFQPSFGGDGASSLGDGFVAALDATGTNLIYCTYLGGSGDDEIAGLAVRPDDGAVAVTGFSDSPNFPLLAAVQPTGFQGLLKSTDAANNWSLSNSGLASGVIYSIQVDPANPSNVYALTKNGLYKSTDGGAHWIAASSGLGFVSPSGSILPGNLLAIDPQHPATVYAGAFAGIYKTTNGAANWTLASTGMPTFPNPQAVAVDPNTPATLYVGTYSSGLFKSTNGGASWNPATNGLTSLNIAALVVDPNNSSNVYAGAGGFTYSPSLFKSTNGGATWNLLNNGVPGGAVALLAANASGIYAVVGGDPGFPSASYPNLVTITNGGLNWSSLLSAAGLNFTALAFAPPAVPALSIANAAGSDLVSWPAVFPGYMLQSTPALNPANWQNVSQGLATNSGVVVATVSQSGAQGYYRLIQTNTAAAAPPTIYLGTDSASGQGVLRSTDGGKTWFGTGPNGDTVESLAVSPANPPAVFLGLNGGRDGFVTTLLPDGTLYSSSYLGGSGADQGNAIALDVDDAYVAGSTSSGDFPTTPHPAVVTNPKVASSFAQPMVFDFGSTGPKPLDVSTNPVVGTDGGEVRDVVYGLLLAFIFPCPKDKEYIVRGQVGVPFQESHPELKEKYRITGSGTLPPGITFTHDSEHYSFDGTPTESNSYTYVLTLSRGTCTYTITYIFKISF
jgi:hypothetical protein